MRLTPEQRLEVYKILLKRLKKTSGIWDGLLSETEEAINDRGLHIVFDFDNGDVGNILPELNLIKTKNSPDVNTIMSFIMPSKRIKVLETAIKEVEEVIKNASR